MTTVVALRLDLVVKLMITVDEEGVAGVAAAATAVALITMPLGSWRKRTRVGLLDERCDEET